MRLRAIDALPASAELRGDLAQKLARGAFIFWQKDLPAGAMEQTALLRPLFEDLMTAENFVDVRGPVGKTQTAIAIELSDERARLWSTNLWQSLRAWKFDAPTEITVEGVKGWEARRNQAPKVFQLLRSGKWLAVGLGEDRPDALGLMLQHAAKSGRPLPSLTNGFLEVQADLPGLGKWFPVFTQFSLPPAHLTMTGRGESVRAEMLLQFPDKVPWTLEPWRIPTNLVSEPLTSFSVARGIAPLLDRVQGFPKLGLEPTPSQICAWGISNDEARVYFAVPVPDGAGALRQLARTGPGFVLSKFSSAMGNFLYVSNRHELIWSGLPFIAPNLRTTNDAGTQYIMGSIFPLYPKAYPIPDELYAQVRGRTNLMYYDWEDTPQRLAHSRQLYRLAIIADRRQPDSTNTPSHRWLSAIRPQLGNTITEIARTGPREIQLVRKSQMGLTGFELATFSAWLDSPGFPFRLELPPSLPRPGTTARPRATPKP
jgi:hypothetical protein